MLDGANGYMCAKCNKKVPAVKQSMIAQLPSQVRRLALTFIPRIRVASLRPLCRVPSQYLILHIVRAEFDPRTAKSLKNASKIKFPLAGLSMTHLLPVRSHDVAFKVFLRLLMVALVSLLLSRTPTARSISTICTRSLCTTAKGMPFPQSAQVAWG